MKRWLLPLLLLAVATIGGAVWIRLRPVPRPAVTPDLAPLREQLQTAAEKAFPLPTLGGWSIEINVPTGEMSTRIAALTDLAQKLGGNAQRVLDRDQAAVLLVQIPEPNYKEFAARAREWPWKSASENSPSSGELSDGEVVLHPSEL